MRIVVWVGSMIVTVLGIAASGIYAMPRYGIAAVAPLMVLWMLGGMTTVFITTWWAAVSEPATIDRFHLLGAEAKLPKAVGAWLGERAAELEALGYRALAVQYTPGGNYAFFDSYARTFVAADGRTLVTANMNVRTVSAASRGRVVVPSPWLRVASPCREGWAVTTNEVSINWEPPRAAWTRVERQELALLPALLAAHEDRLRTLRWHPMDVPRGDDPLVVERAMLAAALAARRDNSARPLRPTWREAAAFSKRMILSGMQPAAGSRPPTTPHHAADVAATR